MFTGTWGSMRRVLGWMILQMCCATSCARLRTCTSAHIRLKSWQDVGGEIQSRQGVLGLPVVIHASQDKLFVRFMQNVAHGIGCVYDAQTGAFIDANVPVPAKAPPGVFELIYE